MTHWPLIGLVWVAFLIRTLHLDGQSLWRDEVDAIRFSSWSLSELLSGLTRTGHNGPLFFLWLRPWRSLSGDSEFALRYPSALLGALAVPLGFSLARQLGFSRATGLLLGLLLATSPYLVWYSQEAKMYALLLVLVTLAFIAYLKALSGAGWAWWLIFILITSLSFYIHILAPLMLIVYGATALCLYPQLRRQKWPWLISMSCLTLPYLPLALWQAGFLLEGTSPGHPFYPLQREFYLLLQLYSRGLIPFQLGPELFETIPIVLFIFLFLCGLFLPAHPVGASASTRRTIFSRPQSPPSTGSGRSFDTVSASSTYPGCCGLLILASWALLPPLVVYLISLRIPVFEDRYLIYIVPPFYLLVALGLTLLKEYSTGLASLALILILTINFTGLWEQQSRPIKADFRAAATYLSNQRPPPDTIMIQMPYLQYTFSYYYPKAYRLLEGVWTNGGKPEAELQREMAQMTANLTDLWLIVSEEEMWDERQMVRRWLDEHAQRVDEAHFTRVELYHYQFPER